MKKAKNHSFCCGAGGGGMWKEESKGERINYIRIKQARESGAEILVSTCPYCSSMFKDGIAETNTENLQTRDLAELLLDNIQD
jgi:Fe-S oxidoreductase